MNARRRPNLLLTELVFDLLIFMLCAAVCAALLVRARGLSRESAALSDAVALAQTAAETLRGGGAAEGALKGETGLEARYTCRPDGGVVTAEIAVWDGAETVYTLTAAWPEARP